MVTADDTLVGGEDDDTLDGGAGRDLASFLDATAGVTVDLTSAPPLVAGRTRSPGSRT
ncbi:MAG: hypothetical protein ACRDKT_09920 [Actinomycetota bacterium]